MKIEIKKNSMRADVGIGEYVLEINDEVVTTGYKNQIIKKISKIMDAWY